MMFRFELKEDGKLNGSHRIGHVLLLAAVLAALFTQFVPSYVAAQISDWKIVVDTSTNAVAIAGTLFGIHQGMGDVSGDIALNSHTTLWRRAYLTEIPYDTILVDGIIVEDADEVWTKTLVESTDLDVVAQGVTPHIISEYGDSLSTLGLVSSDGLDTVATTVSPRVAFEYADSSAPLMLADSTELALIASAVTPRVVVEYSDVIYLTHLPYPVGLHQYATLVHPRIVVEYANVIFETIMTRPNIDSDVTVDISVVLQGGSRPPEAWEVPITIKFFSPGADVMTDFPAYECHCTPTKSGDHAICRCIDIGPGTYDITAQASNCPECTEGNCTLMNVKRSVVISAPSTAVDMGTLLAGDANCDGIVNISDFGILAVAYMCTEGEPCYDCRADFDCNGIVNISDFGLLAVNYMKISPLDISE
jgi:hypothetical protein